MLENEFYLSKLIAAHIRGALNPEQEQELNIWLHADEAHKAFLKSFEEDQQVMEKINAFQSIDSAAAWNNTLRKLDHPKLGVKRNGNWKWTKWAVAASLILVSALGLYVYVHQVEVNKFAIDYHHDDVLPGKNGATLTLSNGKKIDLSDASNGELAKEAGVVISKNAAQQLIYTIKEDNLTTGNKVNTLATAVGQNYQVQLPDGTVVWLNAASTLAYPSSFVSNKTRRVVLSGEAYFEVAKDKKHPFVVKTNKQEIMVLGTHFNVTAYGDEGINTTTLLEGSVHVSHLLNKSGLNTDLNGKVLKPGEQSVLTDLSIQVSMVNTEEAMAWKNGYFRFNKENIVDVMRKLSRWYNIEVIYEGPVPEDEFSGTASRDKSIGQVLKMLQYSKSVQFKVEGRRVTVRK